MGGVPTLPRYQDLSRLLLIDATEGERRVRLERNSEWGRHIRGNATQVPIPIFQSIERWKRNLRGGGYLRHSNIHNSSQFRFFQLAQKNGVKSNGKKPRRERDVCH